jgi:hypothetical protein
MHTERAKDEHDGLDDHVVVLRQRRVAKHTHQRVNGHGRVVVLRVAGGGIG